MFDIMKYINTSYYSNNNIEGLISKNIITSIAKKIKIIKLFRGEKNSKILIKEEARKKNKNKNYYYYYYYYYCVNNRKINSIKE